MLRDTLENRLRNEVTAIGIINSLIIRLGKQRNYDAIAKATKVLDKALEEKKMTEQELIQHDIDNANDSYGPRESKVPPVLQDIFNLWGPADKEDTSVASATKSEPQVIVEAPETQYEGFYSEHASVKQLDWIVLNLGVTDKDYLAGLSRREAHQIIQNNRVRRSPEK